MALREACLALQRSGCRVARVADAPMAVAGWTHAAAWRGAGAPARRSAWTRDAQMTSRRVSGAGAAARSAVGTFGPSPRAAAVRGTPCTARSGDHGQAALGAIALKSSHGPIAPVVARPAALAGLLRLALLRSTPPRLRGFFTRGRRSMLLPLGSLEPEHVVVGILAANFGVFGLWQLSSMRETMSRHFLTSRQHLRAGYVHTLVTHAFSQKDGMHLASNMFTFFFFGSSLGAYLGGARLLQLYLAAGAVGGAAQCWWQPQLNLGASGSVNAVVIFSTLLNPYATYLVYGIVPAPAWLLAILWLGYDFWGAARGVGGIGFASHLGGAATGALAYAAFTAGIW